MEIQNNQARSRFECEVEGHTPFLTYQQKSRSLALLHTDVPAELEGRGVGSSLARAALEHAREHGLQVLPYCPFVKSYIERHPEYADLVRTPAT
jgi:predicted GNAT family acetyltransferase